MLTEKPVQPEVSYCSRNADEQQRQLHFSPPDSTRLIRLERQIVWQERSEGVLQQPPFGKRQFAWIAELFVIHDYFGIELAGQSRAGAQHRRLSDCARIGLAHARRHFIRARVFAPIETNLRFEPNGHCASHEAIRLPTRA